MLSLITAAFLVWRLMPFDVSHLMRYMPFGVSN